MKYLPKELVDIIADFHDYEKYCKPVHKIKYQDVLNDIIKMSEIMTPISAKIAKECWGINSHLIIPYDYMLYDNELLDNENMVGLYNE